MSEHEVIDLRDRMLGSSARIRQTINALYGYFDLTDQDVAERLGMKRASVNSWRRGPAKLTTDMAIAFAWSSWSGRQHSAGFSISRTRCRHMCRHG